MTSLDIIEKLFFPAIVMMMGLMVNFARQIVGQVTDLASSVKLIHQELQIKIGHQETQIRDHEVRIRGIENKKRGVLHGKRVERTSNIID